MSESEQNSDSEESSSSGDCSSYMVGVDVSNTGGGSNNSSATASVSGGCGDSIANQISQDANNFNPNDPNTNDNTEFQQDMASQGYVDNSVVCYDANCTQISCDSADFSDPCFGNANLYSSPVVLSLGEEKPYTAVKFALNPADPESWVIWKASSTHPLLVYDPTGTGTIKDGSQLFGNYTFRGTDRAPKGKTTDEQLWENGYQALASLDQNGDGFLTDSMFSSFFPHWSELNGLALWFDVNQNGVSEPGEVRPLSSVGVTKIRTSFDHKESDGDLVSVNGFERKDPVGVISQGDTLDWFSGAYPNKDAAVRGFVNESPGVATPAPESAPTPQPVVSADVVPSASLAGQWVWEMDDEKGRGGRIVFVERGNGLFGATMLEFKRIAPTGPNAGRVETFLLTGSRQDLPDGKISFEFATSPQAGARAVSRGEFDPFTGEIKARSEVASGGNTLSYSWHARRLSTP